MNLPQPNPDYAVPALENATLIIIFFVVVCLAVMAVAIVVSDRRKSSLRGPQGTNKKPIKPLDGETRYHNSIYKNGRDL